MLTWIVTEPAAIATRVRLAAGSTIEDSQRTERAASLRGLHRLLPTPSLGSDSPKPHDTGPHAAAALAATRRLQPAPALRLEQRRLRRRVFESHALHKGCKCDHADAALAAARTLMQIVDVLRDQRQPRDPLRQQRDRPMAALGCDASTRTGAISYQPQRRPDRVRTLRALPATGRRSSAQAALPVAKGRYPALGRYTRTGKDRHVRGASQTTDQVGAEAHAKKSPGAGLCPQALGELGELYQRALMRAGADQFGPVERPNVNSMRPPIDPGDFGLTMTLRPTGVAARCATSTCVPTALKPGLKVWLDRVQRRVLHHQDHHRRGQHRGQARVLNRLAR